MKSMLCLLGLVVFCAPSRALGQEAADGGIPAEVLGDMAAEVGVWIASNAEYAGENEPWEAYGLEWSWGIGRKSLTGRLYGVIDGEDQGTFWRFRQFWHPGDSVVVVQQFGSDGTFGTGSLHVAEDGTVELVQDFYQPDGTVRRQRHETRRTAAERRGASSHQADDGSWTPGRTYVWIRQP